MSAQPPRSMEATSGQAAASVSRRRQSLPNGIMGVAILICTEATLFSTAIASYYYLRFQDPQWPPPGIKRPELLAPLVLTGILVATSIPMYLARRASLRGLSARCAWLIAGALAVQAGYFGVQMHFFLSDLHSFSPTDTAYGSAYFLLLGLHHAHVVVGMAINAWLITRLIRGLTNYRLIAVRVAGWYWHFVNAMAIAVVLTQLYPSL